MAVTRRKSGKQPETATDELSSADQSSPSRLKAPGRPDKPNKLQRTLSNGVVRGHSEEPGMTDENVFLFVPNIVGYTRVLLAGVALTFMSYHPKYCTVAYIISCLLDAVDGQAARALGQTSKFGAVLDMVTDRCTTSCLLCFLSSSYPSLAMLFQGLITLDFSSHYMHMYSSLVSGSASHKNVTAQQSWILWSYYNNSHTLFFFCAGNELFFVCLYLMKWYHQAIGIRSPLIYSHLPVAILKIVPPTYWSALERLTWPQLVAAITFPICLAKQIINCVQLFKASIQLAEIDREERFAAQQKSR
ncbi:uncharacterized protein L969DRAFT_102063 [Mixia osmundae IAM 14324]|uniref:CDP-diacylglycerol--inositol 3-phosphatidyltransferase n=1 Tax=Mixia osmundae (strain CBS 9802 / IAM 14324 / JCM 22182 / KY 12970) TaxID=764103 RepID=G7E624_MIXOS|nr:uncharacterized protein L969DRAFT_102063 [Mixia osmundae IAM 14324]KEI40566.1 hypothetical protein L969DRAFT_102063 [Mixia osmundae IAM 14324]GAA98284.1 hypothetical protein E5Q_04967 [Mixia osmundae IAM 14324]